jgi:hypothetical protein
MIFSNRDVYAYSGAPEWESPPFSVSKSTIQGYGVFFTPSEKEVGEIMEDSVLFPYGGIIQFRSLRLGNFSFRS